MGLWDHSALPIPVRLGARLKWGFPGRQAGLMSHLLAFGQVISWWVNQPLELGYSSTSARSWDVRAAWQELSSSAGMGTWLSGDLFVDCASDSSCPRPLCQGVTCCPRLPSSRQVPVFHRTLLLDLGGLTLCERDWELELPLYRWRNWGRGREVAVKMRLFSFILCSFYYQ